MKSGKSRDTERIISSTSSIESHCCWDCGDCGVDEFDEIFDEKSSVNVGKII